MTRTRTTEKTSFLRVLCPFKEFGLHEVRRNPLAPVVAAPTAADADSATSEISWEQARRRLLYSLFVVVRITFVRIDLRFTFGPRVSTTLAIEIGGVVRDVFGESRLKLGELPIDPKPEVHHLFHRQPTMTRRDRRAGGVFGHGHRVHLFEPKESAKESSIERLAARLVIRPDCSGDSSKRGASMRLAIRILFASAALEFA